MLKIKNPFKKNGINTQDGGQQLSDTSANQTDKQNLSYKNHSYKLEGTPFFNRKTEEGWIITMGNHRITEATATAEEAETLVFNLNWLTLIRVIATAVENVIDERENIKKGGTKKTKKSIEEIEKELTEIN